jgi:hypothetical protein
VLILAQTTICFQQGEITMRKVIAAAFALAVFASPAFAFQCPALMAEIDAALPTAELTDEERARVEELRAEGEELHNAGDHDASEAALNEARDILGIS